MPLDCMRVAVSEPILTRRRGLRDLRGAIGGLALSIQPRKWAVGYYVRVRTPMLEEMCDTLERAGWVVDFAIRSRHWGSQELANARAFGLSPVRATAGLRVGWRANEEICVTSSNRCCLSAAHWVHGAHIEWIGKPHPLPEVVRSTNNGVLVGGKARTVLERAKVRGLRFVPLRLYPSGAILSTHWMLRAKRSAPPASPASLIRRGSQGTCGVCARNGWVATEVSLVYEKNWLGFTRGVFETWECEWLALPAIAGRLGQAALPWLMCTVECAPIFGQAPFRSFFDLLPIEF